MTGAIVNTAAIAAGGLFGMLFGRFIVKTISKPGSDHSEVTFSEGGPGETALWSQRAVSPGSVSDCPAVSDRPYCPGGGRMV